MVCWLSLKNVSVEDGMTPDDPSSLEVVALKTSLGAVITIDAIDAMNFINHAI